MGEYRKKFEQQIRNYNKDKELCGLTSKEACDLIYRHMRHEAVIDILRNKTDLDKDMKAQQIYDTKMSIADTKDLYDEFVELGRFHAEVTGDGILEYEIYDRAYMK